MGTTPSTASVGPSPVSVQGSSLATGQTHVQSIRSTKKKTRRSLKKRHKYINESFTILGTNAAGLRNKNESLLEIITNLEPGIVMIQETKLRTKNQIKIPGYQIF